MAIQIGSDSRHRASGGILIPACLTRDFEDRRALLFQFWLGKAKAATHKLLQARCSGNGIPIKVQSS